MNNELRQAADLLREADDILIITHARPDGDTLGSGFGLKLALMSLGKRAFVGNSDGVTPKYEYLSGGVQTAKPEFAPCFVVAVDTADPGLFGPLYAEYADRVDLVLDHHPSNTRYGKLNVVRPDSASAGEVLLALVKELGVPLTRGLAVCLYTAVATDTGCFKYGNTKAATHRAAAELLDTGFDVSELNDLLFIKKSPQRIKIERLAADTLRYYAGGRVALVYVTDEMRRQAGAGEDDMEEVSSLTRQIEGVEVGITLKETPAGFKVSLRSGGIVNVSELSATFGGGGHVRAAGFSLSEPLEKAIELCADAVEKALEAAELPC